MIAFKLSIIAFRDHVTFTIRRKTKKKKIVFELIENLQFLNQSSVTKYYLTLRLVSGYLYVHYI